jgi:hypothetical protein
MGNPGSREERAYHTKLQLTNLHHLGKLFKLFSPQINSNSTSRGGGMVDALA